MVVVVAAAAAGAGSAAADPTAALHKETAPALTAAACVVSPSAPDRGTCPCAPAVLPAVTAVTPAVTAEGGVVLGEALPTATPFLARGAGSQGGRGRPCDRRAGSAGDAGSAAAAPVPTRLPLASHALTKVACMGECGPTVCAGAPPCVARPSEARCPAAALATAFPTWGVLREDPGLSSAPPWPAAAALPCLLSPAACPSFGTFPLPPSTPSSLLELLLLLQSLILRFFGVPVVLARCCWPGSFCAGLAVPLPPPLAARAFPAPARCGHGMQQLCTVHGKGLKLAKPRWQGRQAHLHAVPHAVGPLFGPRFLTGPTSHSAKQTLLPKQNALEDYIREGSAPELRVEQNSVEAR